MKMTETDSIMSKMRGVEDTLKDSLHRVEVIEKKLKSRLLTIENRDRLERELEEVKEILRKNEQQLQGLRYENTRSFMVAACLVFVAFLVFGLYSMIFGSL
ncbi:uncharacterized protein LOC105703474 [Orussus abietinus]|uniref:uncharacterized protein LOC105703474 n=1 Tax=Orussus abietinus TaxID=222816 RepID=UPI0006266AED|nr:uncharacterized protein LOC105703474 [Orussus abietinus]